MMTYKTTGTCSREINFDIDEVDGVKVVRNVSFVGGCNGNLKGIGKLVEGMPVEEVIRNDLRHEGNFLSGSARDSTQKHIISGGG